MYILPRGLHLHRLLNLRYFYQSSLQRPSLISQHFFSKTHFLILKATVFSNRDIEIVKLTMELEDFVSRQLELLDIEKEAEVEETRKFYDNISSKELQKRGVCLLQLRIAYSSTGLFNRTVICFEHFWPGKQLSSHKLTSGDIVGVTLQHDEKNVIASGVITKTSATSIHVAFDDSLEKLGLDDSTQYQLIKLANDVTYRRLKRALKDLRTYRGERITDLIGVLFGTRKPSDPLALNTEEIKFFNKNLDSSQKEAVIFALCQREIAIVHGPPGTGKTTTLTEIILQAIKQEKKILVCAPSNIAVDNLVERLSTEKVAMVRLGHPARVLTNIQQYSLDALITSSDGGLILNDIRKELDTILKIMQKGEVKGKQKPHSGIHSLRKELREREIKTTKELLQRSSVVLCTLTSANEDGPLKHLTDDHFDILVIDECSQGIEAACWIPMLRAPKCILAGDHFQLPPTIVSKKAAKSGLEISLMERLFNLYGDTVTKLLTVQYRMHSDIMQWSSDKFYKGKLVAHSSVKTHLLCDKQNIVTNDETNSPLLLIDTAGCDLYESDSLEEESKGNEGEADLVAFHINKLISSGVNEKDIAIITPYNLQVELIRLRVHPKYPEIEIKSVDGFQGREKEAVVISLVRSNTKGEIGFLSELRRLNVAVTRARRHLTVICDSETISSNTELQSFVDYLCSHGEVRSAEQYNDVINLSSGVNRTSTQKKNAQQKANEHKSKSGNSSRTKEKQQQHKKSDKLEKEDLKGLAKDSSKDFENSTRESYLYEKINEQIQDFIKNSSAASYSFPATLSSYERRLVHEIAEKEKLHHTSQGEGEERYIIITKPSLHKREPTTASSRREKNSISKTSQIEDVLTNNKFDNLSITNEVSDEIGTEEFQPVQELNNLPVPKEENVESYVDCPRCHKSLPKNNISLHEVQCQKMEIRTSKSRKVKDKIKEDLPDDFDKLMAAMAKENSTCHFQKCKANTSTLGQICQFCKKKFCLSHNMPEIHGCGTEARQHARQVMMQEHANLGKKKTNPAHRVHLQRKLGKKLVEMADERKPKKK